MESSKISNLVTKILFSSKKTRILINARFLLRAEGRRSELLEIFSKKKDGGGGGESIIRDLRVRYFTTQN